MKTAIISGASKGIGKETAKLFAEKGYNVLINYNTSQELAEQLCAELVEKGLNASKYKADVSKLQEVIGMVDFILDKYGGIDVLVNNAGISHVSLFGDTSETQWDNVMSVNLKGVFNCCQAVLPHMLKNKSGKIINVSSIWGITGASCEVAYSASKAGVIGLTKALAKELGPSNIQVNCVAPGIIETNMNSNFNEAELMSLKEETPLMRFGSALEIAKSIYFLASDDASFYTGQVFSPNGGFLI